MSRAGLPFLLAGLCLWLLTERLGGLEPALLNSSLSQITAHQWLLAAAATAASFWAVGRYDAVLHGSMRTGVPPRAAARSGAAAIAISQLTGFGLVTGALARWRMLAALSVPRAAALTALCAASFLTALGALTGLVHLVVAPSLWAGALALGGLALPLLGVFVPRLPLPPLRASGKILCLTALDTGFAALALWALLPDPSALGFTVLFPAFLLALGAALLSGAPAGLGPFELVLLTALPQVPEMDMLAALIAFRLVYYALPACLGAVALAWPLPAEPHAPAPPPPSLDRAQRAELGVTRQNGAELMRAGTASGFVLRTRQTLTLLFDPLTGPPAPLLRTLARSAARESRAALLYKCSARTACAARAAGFQVQRIAHEAQLTPARFRLDVPARRQLRRKLRQAAKAGVTVRPAHLCDSAALTALDARWQAERGPARGLSMGRFSLTYIHAQRIYIAEADGEPLGFITLHTSRHQHCLDLMRIPRTAPAGTAHALVLHAITAAKNAQIPQLSLAAVPDPALPVPSWLKSDGLAQFKASFAPQYHPLYAAAPSKPTLWLALADLALHIHHPTTLACCASQRRHSAKRIASLSQPCEIKVTSDGTDHDKQT